MRRAVSPRFWLPACAAVLCSASQSIAAVEVPDGFVNEVLVTGLNQPIGMARLPDGRMLVAEQRTGAIRIVLPGQSTASAPVFTVPGLNITGGERGLLGIAVDPGWPVLPYAYFMYSRTGNALRIVRYRAAGDVNAPSSTALQFIEPLHLFDDLPDANPNHNGGRLRFGPDGHLFASLGDDVDHCAAADSTSRKGQILRLDVSGLHGVGGTGQVVDPALLVPEGNPFPAAPLVWAYGLRNPWNFQIDPQNGTLMLADVGESIYDEIDEVLPGDFLGWPWREGTDVYPRPLCPEPGGEGANAFKGPAIQEPHPPQAFAMYLGLMYRAPAGGDAIWPPEYRGFYGSLLYGEYYTGWLRLARRQAGVWAPAAAVLGQPNTTDWGAGFVAAVDFMMDEAGSVLWLAQFDQTFQPGTGAISRIRYAPGEVGVPRPGAAGATLRAMPNPFMARTEIAFTLATATEVRLDVFDVGGRRVRGLVSGAMLPGAHRFQWDGRDDRGAVLPAGVYMARLDLGGRSERVRVLRLR